ncbi:uncharacterized protein LOC111256350 [Setaria italica]|uniref:uncharacterized protein LOC111256350 n=1 Tax=Setaria italica TaxID=4555 RepID=UPI000BE5A339|nr:uncharacterized protein LOC111256350 [Setaria italica]
MPTKLPATPRPRTSPPTTEPTAPSSRFASSTRPHHRPPRPRLCLRLCPRALVCVWAWVAARRGAVGCLWGRSGGRGHGGSEVGPAVRLPPGHGGEARGGRVGGAVLGEAGRFGRVGPGCGVILTGHVEIGDIVCEQQAVRSWELDVVAAPEADVSTHNPLGHVCSFAGGCRAGPWKDFYALVFVSKAHFAVFFFPMCEVLTISG